METVNSPWSRFDEPSSSQRRVIHVTDLIEVCSSLQTKNGWYRGAFNAFAPLIEGGGVFYFQTPHRRWSMAKAKQQQKDETRTIKIFDTTLRDGEQAPGNSMNIEEKLRIAKQLQKLNVDVIEAGFPIASDGDFEAVKKVAQTIKGPQIAGLCRSSDKDIDRAWEALKYAGEKGGSTPLSPPQTSI
jgi:hypothetical protein